MIFVRFLFASFFLFFSSQALAYVPSSDFVLGQWMKKIRRVKTLHVAQVTTLFGRDYEDGQAEISENIWIKRPLQFRMESKYPNGVINELVMPGKSYRVTPRGVERKPPLELLGPLGVLWTAGSKERLISLLTQMKISLEKVRWIQQNGEVAYEMGEESGRRLIFEKNTWIPLGAVIDGREYRFARPSGKGFPGHYPEVIEIKRNEETLSRSQVATVQTGISLKNSIFKLETLHSRGKTK